MRSLHIAAGPRRAKLRGHLVGIEAHPHLRIHGHRDHARDSEIGDVDRVIDGDLQPFIRAYLQMRRGEKSAAS